MRRRSLLTALALLAPAPAARAAEDDRELWTKVTLVAPLSERARASIVHHVRFDQNWGRLRQFMPEPALDWRPFDPLTLNATYRLVLEHDGVAGFEVAHRPHVQTTLAVPIAGPIRARWRTRYQIVFAREEQRWTRDRTLRNRLVVSWTRAGAVPFVAGEYFVGVGNGDGFAPRRWRTSVGVGWGAFDLYARVQGPLGDASGGVEQILGVGYSVELR